MFLPTNTGSRSTVVPTIHFTKLNGRSQSYTADSDTKPLLESLF